MNLLPMMCSPEQFKNYEVHSFQRSGRSVQICGRAIMVPKISLALGVLDANSSVVPSRNALMFPQSQNWSALFQYLFGSFWSSKDFCGHFAHVGDKTEKLAYVTLERMHILKENFIPYGVPFNFCRSSSFHLFQLCELVAWLSCPSHLNVVTFMLPWKRSPLKS